MKNKFKIITPSFNNSEWVEYNVASILNQTYTNWEVIYINDCSTDDTLQQVTELVGSNPKYTIISNEVNRGASYNYFEHLDLVDDNDIVLHIDGDDWLIDNTVLEQLNEFYNRTDCWMTYGAFVVWDGTDSSTPYPQNTPYPEFVHEHTLYRRDLWRPSHMRTYRGFLVKAIRNEDLRVLSTEEYYWHAADLAFQYPAMEMAGKNRIQPLDFYSYVYNQHPNILNRTLQRESKDNSKYEIEIRNKKKYKEGLSGERLPLVNVIGDFRERNSIPKNFSYVYNLIEGEFDITLLQDDACIRYINGEFGHLKGKIVADIHEAPHLFNQQQVYDVVKNNPTMFDRILTFSKDLLTLPNAVLRNGGYESVLNKNIHQQEYPILADESLFQIYPKSKNISFITSNKQFTPYHRFRYELAQFIQQNVLPVDIFGVGINPINMKLDGLKDYKFSVAIENGEFDNYFTEKILDCFLTGTIPIYKGCFNIDEFFNTKGIIKFDTKEELKLIVQQIEDGDCPVVDPVIIKENFETALSYCYNNDRLFEKYLKSLL
jgi:glycosyltransferase involved in cell wall biosynthesis